MLDRGMSYLTPHEPQAAAQGLERFAILHC